MRSRLLGDWGKTSKFGRLLTAQLSKFGQIRQDRTGCDVGYAGNVHQNVSFGAQLFICGNDRVDIVCNLGKVAFDLPQTSLYLLGQQAMGCGRKACFDRSAVFDPRLTRRRQLFKIMKGFTLWLIRLQL